MLDVTPPMCGISRDFWKGKVELGAACSLRLVEAKFEWTKECEERVMCGYILADFFCELLCGACAFEITVWLC